MFTNILLPTDGSDLATKAVDAGIELAKRLGAKVTIVTVVEPFHVLTVNAAQLEDTRASYERHSAEHARQVLGAAIARAGAAGVSARQLTRTGDHPAEEIIAAAGEVGADLIAMASHGRRGLSALMLGSQTAKVLSQAGVPVLVLR
jgi:nucleotide-binding universal stress UspA family protein